MGLGDEIMATAEARELGGTPGDPVYVAPTRWDDAWTHNPRIVREPGPKRRVENRIGHRPYIQGVVNGSIQFNDEWKPSAGELFFTDQELAAARAALTLGASPLIILEPNIKGTQSGENKRWPFDRWQRLANALDGYVVQFKHDIGKQWRNLRSVSVVEANARQALAMVSHASLVVTTDGALHHAAAALGIPAVVIWGGYTSPRHLGYDTHKNIHHPELFSPCGTLSTCEHCRAAMDDITVEEVAEAAKGLLR